LNFLLDGETTILFFADPGKGVKYGVGFVDSDNPLTGDNNYRINLPANIPAANFWSVTL
jgi:hypothetical protein